MFTELAWWLKIGWLPCGGMIVCDGQSGEDYWQHQTTDEYRTIVWQRDYLGFRIGRTVKDRCPPWRR